MKELALSKPRTTMLDLSHWDFATTFSGVQAASLMLGIDPTGAGLDDQRIVPVIQRMKQDYEGALGAAVWAHDFEDSPKGVLPDPMEGPRHLYSLKMFHATGHEHDVDRIKDEHWLKNDGERNFDVQQFHRDEIARWLGATGMSSIYKFKVESNDELPAGKRWPWGDHHTEYLGHLEAAAREFWVNYDPQNRKKTAPKNVAVIQWLKARKVSTSLANAMATMLRADGLPPGPRT
jgi:hypothetical protein